MTRLQAAIEGRLDEALRRDAETIRRASREAAREVSEQAKDAARGVINARFRGSQRVKGGSRRVANAIRSRTFDNADGTATGLVYSKFGRRRGAEFVDYLLPFVQGAEIVPRERKWLYVPLDGTRRGRRQRREVLAEKGVEFVPAAGGAKVYIVKRTRTKTTLIAVLVRRLRVERSLDFAAVVDAADRKFAEALLRRLAPLED